jgi:hypothetical protein
MVRRDIGERFPSGAGAFLDFSLPGRSFTPTLFLFSLDRSIN